jgi:hypothetical protein
MIAYIKLLLIPLLVFQSGLHFKQEDGKVLLYDGDELIFSYQVETKSHQGQYPRANYIHPLNDFAGNSITEDFPEDHLHHRGIFWTWHQLYLDGQSVADPWMCEDISWKVHNVKHQIKKEKAIITATVDWLIGEDQQNLVREQVEVAYHGAQDHFLLDFKITLESLKDDVSIGGSDDNKGYGGFSPRLALGDQVTFTDASGTVTPDNEPVQAGNWIVVSDIGAAGLDVAIMYHPESTAALQGWILRAKGSMQNPVWPGRDRAVLNQGDQVEMIARLVVFRDQANPDQVENIYQDFLK